MRKTIPAAFCVDTNDDAFTMADGLAIGAIDAMKAAGRFNENMIVAGCDGGHPRRQACSISTNLVPRHDQISGAMGSRLEAMSLATLTTRVWMR